MPSSDQPCEAAKVASSSQRLGKGDQEGTLLARYTDLKKLEGQRRLARACLTFQQIEGRSGQSAHQDTIQAVDAGG